MKKQKANLYSCYIKVVEIYLLSIMYFFLGVVIINDKDNDG